jgi:RNA polymerase sigma-70 factor (ECF subfamily)
MDLVATVEALPAPHAVPLTAEDFDGLVQRCQRRVFRVLRSLFRDDETAETLTQECLLRAFRRRDTYRGEASPETWLLTIAVNLARDHMRSRRFAFWRRLRRTSALEAQAASSRWAHPGPSPERALRAREEVAALWVGLEALPARQRTVFVLRFVEEMSLAEIATVLGLSVGSVKVHLHRATGNLRARLGRAR